MRLGRANSHESGGILVNLIVLVSFVIFCAVLYLARHPILRFMAESWIIEDQLDKADVLIVLSDDNFYADRATRAAVFFRGGKGPRIVGSGRRVPASAGSPER